MQISRRDRQFQRVLDFVQAMHPFRETPTSLRCKLGTGDVEVVREALEWCVAEGTLKKRTVSSDTLYYTG